VQNWSKLLYEVLGELLVNDVDTIETAL